jgi:hypothetical protein
MLDLNLLGNIKFVIDSKGKRAAVQMDMKTWEALLDYLEDLEDQSLVKEKLIQLRTGPADSGAVPWQSASDAW